MHKSDQWKQLPHSYTELHHDDFDAETASCGRRNSICLSPGGFLTSKIEKVETIFYLYFELANPTIIDREGVFYLSQVTSFFEYGLELDDFPVNVNYKTYYNSRHLEYKTG